MIIDGVRSFHSFHCPWQLAISMKLGGYFLSQGILFPETCMLDYSKKKKLRNSIDVKEKLLFNYFLHLIFFNFML